LGRAARILLIAFQVLFLNVVLPGHTRGVITLSGKSSSAGAACCHSKHGDSPAKPSERDKAECAVCFFAARVTPPPVVDLGLTRLGLAEVMAVAKPVTVESAQVELPIHGRAPPVA
jgi:hypothetical protein